MRGTALGYYLVLNSHLFSNCIPLIKDRRAAEVSRSFPVHTFSVLSVSIYNIYIYIYGHRKNRECVNIYIYIYGTERTVVRIDDFQNMFRRGWGSWGRCRGGLQILIHSAATFTNSTPITTVSLSISFPALQFPSPTPTNKLSPQRPWCLRSCTVALYSTHLYTQRDEGNSNNICSTLFVVL